MAEHPITQPVTHSIDNKLKKTRWQQRTTLPYCSPSPQASHY